MSDRLHSLRVVAFEIAEDLNLWGPNAATNTVLEDRITAILTKHRVLRQPSTLGCVLSRKGGAWVAAARGWMQTRFRNGESVTWGSHDLLEGAPVTVRDIEEVAAEAAAAALNEAFNCYPT